MAKKPKKTGPPPLASKGPPAESTAAESESASDDAGGGSRRRVLGPGLGIDPSAPPPGSVSFPILANTNRQHDLGAIGGAGPERGNVYRRDAAGRFGVGNQGGVGGPQPGSGRPTKEQERLKREYHMRMLAGLPAIKAHRSLRSILDNPEHEYHAKAVLWVLDRMVPRVSGRDALGGVGGAGGEVGKDGAAADRAGGDQLDRFERALAVEELNRLADAAREQHELDEAALAAARELARTGGLPAQIISARDADLDE